MASQTAPNLNSKTGTTSAAAAPAPSANSSRKPSRDTGTSSVGASDISAAQANGKVWANLDSHVYHKGGQWYGKTKHGKFMTEEEAKQAGYRESKRD
ncbi:MAG: hypothetical protein NVS1B11_33510 [Terriglobales bacterium]